MKLKKIVPSEPAGKYRVAGRKGRDLAQLCPLRLHGGLHGSTVHAPEGGRERAPAREELRWGEQKLNKEKGSW